MANKIHEFRDLSKIDILLEETQQGLISTLSKMSIEDRKAQINSAERAPTRQPVFDLPAQVPEAAYLRFGGFFANSPDKSESKVETPSIKPKQSDPSNSNGPGQNK